MLKEIRCSEFKDNNGTRNPIVFHSGLNTVMGSSNAKNSIGKSTFLLAIDFAFGGVDYVEKNDDMINNVPPHTIYFKFEFSGKEYVFGRNTDDYKNVYKCDKDFNTVSVMPLSRYTEWLSEMYGMTDLGGTFRDLVNGTFRVYGKNNHDEIHPLKSFASDTAEAGIKRLLKLYGYYRSFLVAEKKMLEDADAEKVYQSAHKYEFVSGITNEKDYEANQKRIAELIQRKEELAKESNDGLLELDSFQSTRLAQIDGEIRRASSERGKLRARLTRLKNEKGMSKPSLKESFDAMKDFFSDSIIKRLEEIEGFHKQIGEALDAEYNEAEKTIEAQIAVLDDRLEYLSQQRKEIDDSPSLKKSILDEYSSIIQEIDRLKKSNQYYKNLGKLKDAAKKSKEEYLKIISEQIDKLLEEINSGLASLNKAVCGEHELPPNLHISSPTSYTYKIPNNSGTGARTRGMFLLDLLALNKTPLPAVIEDSVSIKQVEDNSLLNVLQLFNGSPKQCFIAMDKANSYSEDGTIPKILEESTILELSEGNELYGRAWNRK